jgi:hypothetical protein
VARRFIRINLSLPYFSFRGVVADLPSTHAREQSFAQTDNTPKAQMQKRTSETRLTFCIPLKGFVVFKQRFPRRYSPCGSIGGCRLTQRDRREGFNFGNHQVHNP